MLNPNHVIIEQNKKFSESCLWNLQREYFDREGIDAWVKEVPHYVTSNPFLADCYARVAVRMAQDWVNKYPESKKQPFYIIELGTGSGQLSYYVVKRIKQLKKALHLEDVNIVYVMTDFTESNLKFWDSHPALQEFVQDKMLDFALFNMEIDTALTLRKAGTTLSPGSVNNPMVIFANYIFDTVSNDAFISKNGNLHAALVRVSTDPSNMRNDKPVALSKLEIDYQLGEIGDSYYENSDFNKVLDSYKNILRDSHFLIPIAGLKALANLRKISNDKILLVSSDKGYTQIEELEGLGHPHIDFHGSFSMMVNFHAIAKYFEHSGGTPLLQTQRAGVKTNVFYSGFNITDLPELSSAVHEHVERLSPGDYFILHRNISENFRHSNIDTLVAHMVFAQWDPHIYEKLSRQICEQITSADRVTTEYLVKHLPEMASNFYFMPETYDVLFDIGVLLHTLRLYNEALKYYEQSKRFFGEKFDLLYNVGICEYNAGFEEKALETFKYALTFRPDSDQAKQFITFIENKMKTNDAE